MAVAMIVICAAWLLSTLFLAHRLYARRNYHQAPF